MSEKNIRAICLLYFEKIARIMKKSGDVSDIIGYVDKKIFYVI